MDYTTAFAISRTGMEVERTRLDVVALNLANANTVAGPDGEPYQPLRVLAETRGPRSFAFHMGDALGRMVLPGGSGVRSISPMDVAPRRVHEPGHPAADGQGFVQYPNVNPVSEMLELIEATRAYEANVRALNAAKSMALAALDIGRPS